MAVTTVAVALAALAVVLAAFPSLLFARNARLYRPAPMFQSLADKRPAVSVVIPARNEEQSLPAALAAVLASRGVELEVIVVDDHSSDRTAAIVRGFAAVDPRVRLSTAPALPTGWCGKQHACAVGAAAARFERLLFVDADVRLTDDALARICALLDGSGAALVSGFPRQETVTPIERLLLPLMHFLLLGFLPLGRMRASTHPMYGAACGQLIMASRLAYETAGGHAAVRATLHDGLKLPRAMRAAGFFTDLFDATDLATCRMYRSAGEVWRGLAKNAREGMATAAAIVPWTLALAGGQMLGPTMLLGWLAAQFHAGASFGLHRNAGHWLVPLLAAIASGLAYLPRLWAAARFRQSWLGAALHPLGVLLLLVIQWQALIRGLFGRAAVWKDRPYPTAQRSPASRVTTSRQSASDAAWRL